MCVEMEIQGHLSEYIYIFKKKTQPSITQLLPGLCSRAIPQKQLCEQPRDSVVKRFLLFLCLASEGLPLAPPEEVTQCFVLVNCPFDQLRF